MWAVVSLHNRVSRTVSLRATRCRCTCQRPPWNSEAFSASSAPTSSDNGRLVGKLVHVTSRVVGEVLGESACHLLDAIHEAAAHVAGAEALRYRMGDSLPEIWPNSPVNRHVAENHELSSSWDDEEEHAVPVARLRNSEAHESALCRPLDIPEEVRGDRDDDFAGGPTLGLLNGASHPGLVEMPGEALTAQPPHIVTMSPARRRRRIARRPP